MGVRAWLGQYLAAAVVFLGLDLLWLGLVARPWYAALLGDLLAEDPRAGAAVAFYAVYVAGLVHFVTAPAVRAGSLRSAVLGGGFLGLVCYAAWDLTSLAVLADFPALLVPLDLAWGAAVSAATAAATYGVAARVPALRPAPAGHRDAPGR